MSEKQTQAAQQYTLMCRRCDRATLVRSEWVGRDVQCPHCSSVQRVPPPADDGRPVRGDAPSLAPQRNFNFACTRCGCLLEAHTGMSGREGVCPTCGASFIVPDVDPHSGRPGRARILEREAQNPTPLHAYAASGRQAPILHRRPDGELEIECPRCGSRCDVEANLCRACGAPFTLESAPNVERYRSEDRGTAAIVLGIVSVPMFWLVVPGVLAVVFGALSLWRGAASGRVSPRGVIGLVLGVLSLSGAAALALFG